MDTSKSRPNVVLRTIITILIVVIVGYVLYFFINQMGGFLPGLNASRASVSYLVEGTVENAVITYTKADGKVTEPHSVSVPWRSSNINVPSRTLVILTAAATEDGTIKCTIFVGNTIIDSNMQDPFEDKALCGGYVK